MGVSMVTPVGRDPGGGGTDTQEQEVVGPKLRRFLAFILFPLNVVVVCCLFEVLGRF